MIQLRTQSVLIAWLATFLHLAHAAPLVMDGLGSITGYGGSVYRAFKYRPICGTLDASGGLGQLPQQVGPQCSPAMSQYRIIPDTFALYDVSGVRLPDTSPIGLGTTVCMCFSMSEVVGGSKRANFCTLVDNAGSESVAATCAGLGCPVAIGNYEIGSKSLPKCFDIDLASVTGSLAALGGQTAAQIVAPSTSSPIPSTSSPAKPNNTSPTKIATGNTNPTNGVENRTSGSLTPSGASSSGSITPGGPLAIGIWMPIIFSFVVAAFTVYYKRKHYQLAKQKAEIEKLKKERQEWKGEGNV